MSSGSYASSSSFSAVARELELFLSPVAQASRANELLGGNSTPVDIMSSEDHNVVGGDTVPEGAATPPAPVDQVHVRADEGGHSVISSTSVASYWGRATKRSKEEILQRRVVCDKSKRGPEGSRERDIHHKNATYALSQVFGAAAHFIPKNSEGESESTKYSDIQSEYVGNLTKVKLLEARVMGYDMLAPFIIPKLVDSRASTVGDRWGDPTSTGLNLFQHWSKLSLSTVALYQKDSYENCADDEDIVSCEWTKELFVNSSSPALVKRIEEKYEALDGLAQGGITYLKIALDEMFDMSDIVITSLQDFFKNFARDGVAKYPSENVALLVQQINAVAERLAEAGALPRDTPLLMLTGFAKCSVPEFVGPFELLLNSERVTQLENSGDRHDNARCLDRVKKLTLLASNSFHSLNVSNKWNIPSSRRHRHGMAQGHVSCDNCGGDHYAPDCPHPRDEAKIKKAKEDRAARKANAGRGQGRGGGPGRGRGGGRGQQGRQKWGSNNSDNNSGNGNGVQHRGNAWMCYCKRKTCGWNHTHTSGFHASWKRDPSTFSLPSDHDYWKLSGKSVPGSGSSGGSNGGTGGGQSDAGQGGALASQRSALSEVISRHQGESADATFSSFLTDFAKVMENLK